MITLYHGSNLQVVHVVFKGRHLNNTVQAEGAVRCPSVAPEGIPAGTRPQ